MKADVTIGISDISYVHKDRSYGPILRFSLTHRVDLEDGKVLGDTIPGFLVRKRDDGSFSLWPPVHRSTPSKTYQCALITQDEKDLILGMLGTGGFLKKVGKNNAIKKLAELEPDLMSDLPSNFCHK